MEEMLNEQYRGMSAESAERMLALLDEIALTSQNTEFSGGVLEATRKQLQAIIEADKGV
jgi:hypothetical protein